MVQQSNDRRDTVGAQPIETVIDPVPCAFSKCFDAFPENWEANGADSELSQTLDVVRPDILAAALQLIDVLIAYAIQGTLDASPHLQRVSHASAHRESAALPPRAFARFASELPPPTLTEREGDAL